MATAVSLEEEILVHHAVASRVAVRLHLAGELLRMAAEHEIEPPKELREEVRSSAAWIIKFAGAWRMSQESQLAFAAAADALAPMGGVLGVRRHAMETRALCEFLAQGGEPLEPMGVEEAKDAMSWLFPEFDLGAVEAALDREAAGAIAWAKSNFGDAPSADSPDAKPDSQKKIPRSERVLKAIAYVKEYYRKVESGRAPRIPETAILSMFLDKPVEDKEVANLHRQLRNYRHLMPSGPDS